MFGKDKPKNETKVFGNTETNPKLGKDVSQKDFDDMTKYYKTIYRLHTDKLQLEKLQVGQADEMLKDSVKWNDLGAQTLRKAGVQRIIETEKFIQDLISKCNQYYSVGKLDKFW